MRRHYNPEHDIHKLRRAAPPSGSSWPKNESNDWYVKFGHRREGRGPEDVSQEEAEAFQVERDEKLKAAPDTSPLFSST